MISISTKWRLLFDLLWSASLVYTHWGHVDGGQLIVTLCKSFFSQKVVLQDLLGNLSSKVCVVFLAATLTRVAPFDATFATVILNTLAEAIALTVSVQLRFVLMCVDQLLKVIFVSSSLSLIVTVLLWLLVLLLSLFVLELDFDLLMLYFRLLQLGALLSRRCLLVVLSCATASLLLKLSTVLWVLRLRLQEYLNKFLRQIIIASFEWALILDGTALVFKRFRPLLSKYSLFRIAPSLVARVGSVNASSGIRRYELSCLFASVLDIVEVLTVDSFGGSLWDFHFEIDWLRVVALAAAQVIDDVWLLDFRRSVPFLGLRIELPLDFLPIDVCHKLLGIIYLELCIRWRIKTHRLPSAGILLRLGRVPGVALIVSHVWARDLFG